ncbi:MAG: TIR domain-containing protein [Chitinophagaceae bacterium]
MEEQLVTSETTFDLFISYSNDPDYQLSRKIEAFLESFHKLKTPKDVILKVLLACRDGSDFSLHSIKKQAAETARSDDFVEDVLVQYLQRSEYLLVLCSRKAALSKYVQLEIDWFIKNKGIDHVLLAVTEGNNLKEEEKEIFSENILQHKLHTKIFYDLRGFKKEAKGWQKVRDHEEELTNVAAFLNKETSGKILPLWRREERKKLKKQRYIGIAAALVFLTLAIVAFFQRQTAVRNEKIALDNLKSFKKEQFQRNMRNGKAYFDAREFLFARKEFMNADSIIQQYPDDSSLVSQRGTLKRFLQQSNNQSGVLR